MATWGVSLNAVPSRPLPMGRECSMRHVAVAVCSLVLVALILLTTSIATATITQGDFSVYGFFETREAGRWGEVSSSMDSTPTKLAHPTVGTTFAIPGQSFGMTGGTFDFDYRHLAQSSQFPAAPPHYHIDNNNKLPFPHHTLFFQQ